MSLLTRALSWMIKLPPARVRRIAIERGLRITMPDGIDLLADRYAPAQPGPHPTVLIRTPYGRGAPFTWFAKLFAERGYAVVLQSCRGTFGSGGVYSPFHHEATDGAASLDWLSAQSDTGPIAMFGPSYVGYTQWAVVGHPALRAHAMQVTSSQFRTPIQSLESDVDVVGPVTVELFVSTSIEHADVFARLCDVDARGRSINVCDALQRLRPGDPPVAADGVRKVRIELFPTAQRFRRGHRIRVQISGGAHPRFARNLGTGENASVGAEYRTCEHRVFHDERHPSALVLPILTRS